MDNSIITLTQQVIAVIVISGIVLFLSGLIQLKSEMGVGLAKCMLGLTCALGIVIMAFNS